MATVSPPGSPDLFSVPTRPASGSVYAPLPPPVTNWSARMSGLSWALLNPAQPDGDVVDKIKEETGERFIMKADMQIVTSNGMHEDVKNRTVMLTAEHWIEMKMVAPVKAPLLPSPSSPAILSTESHQTKRKKLTEIHSVEKEPMSADNPYPHAFRICFFSGSASSIVKGGLGKFKRLLQVGSTFDDFLKSKIVRCHSAEEM